MKKEFKRRIKNNKGFTLLELIVVITIIAVLSLTVSPMVLSQIEKAKVSSILADIDSFKKAIVLYYADTGGYPAANSPTDEGYTCKALVENDNSDNWDGPYLSKPVINPQWKDVDIQYVLDATDSNPYLVFSGDGVVLSEEGKGIVNVYKSFTGGYKEDGDTFKINLYNSIVTPIPDVGS